MCTLSDGEMFTKIDLPHAYQQLHLDEESSKLVIVSTPKGLFHYLCLPFGVSATPSIFQCTMDNLLQGIPNVCVYLDDGLVAGHTDAKHFQNLTEVLRRMAEAGTQLKRF